MLLISQRVNASHLHTQIKGGRSIVLEYVHTSVLNVRSFNMLPAICVDFKLPKDLKPIAFFEAEL